ncbi:hypothetical protein Fot_07196 [Forsythia ovata]|uniref:Uncharacterized protein n=1 Tax=Forsythia ovata TaxID=205694 RepID=A0ABD1WVG2_9LAMI
MAARSLMLIEKTEMEDRDYFWDQVTWLQSCIGELKKEVKTLAEDKEKFQADLANSEAGVVEFSKKCDHANQTQEITAKALAKANLQREGLVDKIAQLDEVKKNLQVECSGLKETNLEIEKGTE